MKSPVPAEAPRKPAQLARDAEYHRRQAESATARGDAAEADLWSALADEIDGYIAAGREAGAPDLFAVPDG